MYQLHTIHTDNAPAAIGPYSQARVHNGVVYCSGQIALTANGEDFTQADVATQTRIAMTNLKHVLHAAGSSFERVLKVTIFLIDMEDFATVNTVYASYFSKAPPARATVAVSTLPKNAKVEIDCIAAVQA